MSAIITIENTNEIDLVLRPVPIRIFERDQIGGREMAYNHGQAEVANGSSGLGLLFL